MGENTTYYHGKGKHSQHWEAKKAVAPDKGTVVISNGVRKYIWGKDELPPGCAYKVTYGDNAGPRDDDKGLPALFIQKNELANGKPYNPNWGE